VGEFGDSKVGKWITEKTSGLVAWRHGRTSAAAIKKLDAALKACEHKPRGIFGMLPFLKDKPLDAAHKDALQSVFKELGAAKPLSGKERVTALESAKAAMAGLAEKGVPKEIISHIDGKLGAATNMAMKSSHFGQVMEGGVATWLRHAGKGAGRMSFVTAGIALGVAAGAGVAFLTAKRDNKASAADLKSFAADVGNDKSAMLQDARGKNMQQVLGRHVGAVLSTAGDTLMLKGSGAADMMSIVPLQMGLMSAGGMLGGENAVVTAHATLHQAEIGEITLDGKDKVDAMKKIVAAVPEVKAQGGEYNLLTGSVAEALVEKMDHGMKLRDVMHLLDDKAAFRTFATEVKAKQSAAQAPKDAAAAGNDNIHAANDRDEPAASALQAPMIAAHPHIAASTIEHMGTIAAETALRRA